MRAYLSTGLIRPDAFTSTDPVELQHRAAYQARVEVMAILSDTEPENPGPSGFMAHPGCYVWQAGLFCAECMTPQPRAALAEALAAFTAD